MIKSMTGFGRAESNLSGFNISIQIKSVNHRYGDFSIRLPRIYGFLEDFIRSEMSKRISRGKVDIGILIEKEESDDVKISLNKNIAKGYINALKQLEEFGVKNDISMSSLSRFNDIFTIEQEDTDEDALKNAVSEVLALAAEEFDNMRLDEGERMEQDIISHLDIIQNEVKFIESRSSVTVLEYRKRLEGKIREVLGDRTVDEDRVLTECAIFADKIATEEETVRLKSHIQEFKNTLKLGKPVGKKLDFIIQEMNRETNTIGSKASDIEISKKVVEIKAEIEKIREQVQNIE